MEKLQKLAEKVHQEAKVTDSKLDDIEAWIEEEAKRVDHLHPKGKNHALKKYDQFILNTSCFRIKYLCAMSRNFCFEYNELVYFQYC